MRLKNKRAIITGAARGIGAAIADLFIAEGAQILITDILLDEGHERAETLGDKAHFLKHDVSSSDDWDQVMAYCKELFGGVDILVNNAGILIFEALETLSPEAVKHILEVNLYGTIIGTQAVGRVMIEQGNGGSIINMSSADGLSAANGLGAYVASKWGVRGFTKAAALEFGLHNIRVNSIHPGGVDTPMANPTSLPRDKFNLGFKPYAAQRGCSPVEIAHAALYFACDDSAYCMGAELAIDGGLTAGHYYFGFPGAPDLNFR